MKMLFEKRMAKQNFETLRNLFCKMKLQDTSYYALLIKGGVN